ncbi:MAG: ABC transporter ATP-binding protein [Clostridia bacterium]|nr:ABC transporter ATP-binding protein [Oscillospiraceae bacterium]MBQ7959722.1 ABC transporter ATP-binding protein [Clostridia bacterium]
MKDRSTLKWIYNQSKAQLPVIVLLAVFRCTITVLGVVFALYSKTVIDAAVSKDFDGLVRAAVSLAGIIVLQIILRLIGQAVEAHIGAKLILRLRNNIFTSILKKDYSAATSYHSGDILTRINHDTSIVSNGIMSLVPSVMALLVGLVYALYSLTRLDRNFAFIFLFGGILLLLVISAFRKVLKRTHKRVQETEAKVRSFFQESLGSLLMIKVFGIEQKMSQRAASLQDDNYKAQMTRRNLTIFSTSGLSMVFSAGSFYALVWSAYRLFMGTISFGTLTAIIQLVNQIQTPFASLSGVVPQYYSIIASAERIIEIDTLPEEKEEHALLEPVAAYKKLKQLRFENLSFGYGRDIVLENADLTVEKGDFAVIGGISGIGKSTLIKLLLGVLEPQQGKILLEMSGETVETGKFARPLFSYVPQGNLLLSGTIREAISMVKPEATDEEIMKAAEISCAADFIRKLPEGLDTYIGEKGMGLSEGQVQRLAVSRAILSDAPVILLDEATSALDEATEEQLLKNIRALENKTCVIISHKRAAFDICNKHIYIENKKIRVVENEM